MDDKMADSEMIGGIQSDAFEAGFKVAKELKSYIERVRGELKNIAEDRTMPMDVQVHNTLWHEIQSIDHELENTFKGVK